MICDIIPANSESLRKKSKKVKKIDKKTLALIDDLKDTIAVQMDPEGIGLAAPQIGKNVQVFVMRYKGGLKVVLNPKIIKFSKKTRKVRKKSKKIMEGCLSVPHYYGYIKRPYKVKLKYLDLDGEYKTEDFMGLPAQIIQHEVDHLNGVLFVDRLLEQKQSLYEYVDGEWEVVDLII